ncbi:ABC transporter ATP-binding protein [Phytohabitans rumicis]|uniref:Multidrug ABC transporter permease n=1 Tax=Phytohabitans rumicis TaxID=1076125 RepID=A0A6V8KN02_9ACTN|nr:ATP-binding cassette domain-containing protein [Phytohabitans rumicis]GFJ86543.1 multidrug ABC transporter permease [Phytohabitans rumicis]
MSSILVASVRVRVELLVRLPWVGPGLLAALVGLTVLASVVPAATAATVGWLIDRLTDADPDHLLSAAAPALSAYTVVLLIGHAATAVRAPLSYLAEARIDGRHRAELSRLAAGSPTIDALERPEVQALIRTARADPESFMDGTPGAGVLAQLNLIGRSLALATSALVLAAYAWWTVPLLVVPAVVLHQLRWHEGRQRRRVWRNVPMPSMRADLWSDALVSPAEGKEIRVFGLGEWAIDRIDRHLRPAYDPLWPMDRRILAATWQQLVAVLVPLGIVYVVVAVDAARGGAPVAVATAALVAGTGVFEAFDDAPQATLNAITCVRAFTRVRAELAGGGAVPPPAPEPAGTRPEPPLIRFEGVGFRYPGTESVVLDGLDLQVRPGELLAIVGVNGAGKSTLIKLLAGLYEPTAGRITADGRDLADIGPAAWRARLSVVFQDFVRYHLSAADNVALGNALAVPDMAAVVGAARDAGFDAVVSRLPGGWDTPLARARDGGVDLSGGQWQQVVLARALYALRTGAQVLVLDEPTAHLDVRTERDVFDRLAAHRGAASVILISHRLSTVRRADRIVLVSGGRITEDGTHEELIAAGGTYASMFAIQAQRFQRGFDDRLEEGELT